MPVTACPHCRRKFKVPVETIGQTLECPRCGEEFRALPLRAAPRPKSGPHPVVYAAVVVVAVLVAIVVRAVFSSSGSTRATEPDATAARPDEGPGGRAERHPSSTERSSPTPRPPASPEEAALERVRELVDLLRDPESPLLPGRIDFQALYEERRARGEEKKPWSDLQPEERYAVQERLLSWVCGDERDRRFRKAAVLEDARVVSVSPSQVEVRAVLRNPLDHERREVVFRLRGLGETLRLAGLERGPIEKEGVKRRKSDAGTPPDAAPLLEGITARTADEADPHPVEPFPDTPASVRSRILRDLETLLDPKATVEASRARRRLVAEGRHAVPFLLDALSRLDLSRPEDSLRGQRITIALTEITDQDWMIVPGDQEGSMVGEGRAENDRVVRRWFGWWKRAKQRLAAGSE